VKAGGCASKLSPKILDQVLPRIPRVADPNVLVGFDTSDDAGVYRVTPDLAIVQTVDFFTPVVDDPYAFGAIAAANAILAWPASGDIDTLEEILKGGAEKIHEAGCVILGGHSVSDPEIKFGYAITGTVHPDRVKTNTGARPGDVLMFTKKIGTGVISTALKKGIAKQQHVDRAMAQMMTLNRAAAEAIENLDVHGLTDVTGFGLFGHAREMAIGSRVTLEIDSSLVRFLDGAVEYAQAGAFSGGLGNNREFVASCVEGTSPFDDLFYDPQTSGGLLIALPEKDASELEQKFPAAYRIGRVLERQNKPLRVL
jgi:selenide,water dikinase